MKILSFSLIGLKGFLLSCLFLMGSTQISPCHGVAQADTIPCDACYLAESTWSEEGVFEKTQEVVEVELPKFHTSEYPVEPLAVSPKIYFRNIQANNKDPIFALRSKTIQLRT